MDVLCTVKNSVGDPLVESHFIMVARCPQSGKAAPVVQLAPKTEVEMQNYERSANLSQVRFFNLLCCPSKGQEVALNPRIQLIL